MLNRQRHETAAQEDAGAVFCALRLQLQLESGTGRIILPAFGMIRAGGQGMNPLDFDFITRRLERTVQRMEQLHLDAYLRHVHNWPRRLLGELLNGVVRGIGFSIGFTLLGALLLYILQNIALANLPVIGRFLADLVKIVENNL